MPPRQSRFIICLRALPCAALLLAGPRLSAQSAHPSSPGSPPRTQPPDPSSQTSQPLSTIKVSVRRVVVDITVTDAHGKPVEGLAREQFKVFEDGVQQGVRSFEVHKLDSSAPAARPKLPANTFSNFSSSPSAGPITVILYDLLNTPLASQAFAHAQLLDFLKHRQQSGQVAVFVLSDRLHMLQGFTEDDNKLIAALNFQKARGYRSALLQEPGESTQASDSLAHTEGNQNGSDAQQDEAFQDLSGMLKNMQADEATYQLDQRIDLTAQALQQIARFLVGLPGRKNLLWLSGSFPTGIIPNGDVNGRDPATGRNEYAQNRNYTGTIVQATNLLNLGHIAVYPIDARGVQSNSMFSAGSNIAFEPGQGKDLAAVRNFSQQMASEHATMNTIADNTGGRASYNTNSLKDAAAEAVQEGSLYYTLSYEPTNRAVDVKLRRVRVDLLPAGYRLAYRKTYFPEGTEQHIRDLEEVPTNTLAVALEHGGPSAHDLFFEAHVTPEGKPFPATPAQMEELSHYEAASSGKRPQTPSAAATPTMLQKYVINYGLLPRQLGLQRSEDGTRRSNLQFAAMAFDRDGNTMEGVRTNLQDVIQPERYAFMLESGYHMLQSINVPAGAQSIRMAVADQSNNHVGSLEVSLPIAPEPPAAAASLPVPSAPASSQPAH